MLDVVREGFAFADDVCIAVLLSTKLRFPMGPGANDRGLFRHHIVRACEASLKRLRTDYIDLYWHQRNTAHRRLSAADKVLLVAYLDD